VRLDVELGSVNVGGEEGPTRSARSGRSRVGGGTIDRTCQHARSPTENADRSTHRAAQRNRSFMSSTYGKLGVRVKRLGMRAVPARRFGWERSIRRRGCGFQRSCCERHLRTSMLRVFRLRKPSSANVVEHRQIGAEISLHVEGGRTVCWWIAALASRSAPRTILRRSRLARCYGG